MSGASIIIIIGGSGGGNRAVTAGAPYPVSAGDSVQNTATSGPAVEVNFTDAATNTTAKLSLGTGDISGFLTAGTVYVP